MPWTWSQLTTLARIVNEGTTTTAALAQAEHVHRQSMAETVARLRADGLVVTDQDPDDGRKTLIDATPTGRELITKIPAARVTWLDTAFRTLLKPDELQTLRKAAAIMTRIADSEL